MQTQTIELETSQGDWQLGLEGRVTNNSMEGEPKCTELT